MSDRDDLAEAILGFAAVVSLVVESYERQDPEETTLTADLKARLREAALAWSDEHPDVPPAARVMVRRLIFSLSSKMVWPRQVALRVDHRLHCVSESSISIHQTFCLGKRATTLLSVP